MDLKDYLLNAGKVPQRQLKYYLIWISKYNGYCKRYPQNNLPDYLDSLSDKYQDWQVVQAGKAVNLYKYYLAVHSDRKEIPAVEIPVSWIEREEKIRGSCKFQYKSYSTEKSYIYWIRTFGRYLDNKEPDTVSELDVKNFLTYLTVQRKLAASTQKQAFIALLFFFRNVLFKKISNLNDVVRSSQ